MRTKRKKLSEKYKKHAMIASSCESQPLAMSQPAMSNIQHLSVTEDTVLHCKSVQTKISHIKINCQCSLGWKKRVKCKHCRHAVMAWNLLFYSKRKVSGQEEHIEKVSKRSFHEKSSQYSVKMPPAREDLGYPLSGILLSFLFLQFQVYARSFYLLSPGIC